MSVNSRIAYPYCIVQSSFEGIVWYLYDRVVWECAWKEFVPIRKLDCFRAGPIPLVQLVGQPSRCKIVAAFFQDSLHHYQYVVLYFVGETEVMRVESYRGVISRSGAWTEVDRWRYLFAT